VGRVLSDRELTVAYLARQMLLDRQDRPAGRAVQALAALQAQYSPSPYIALFARLASFQPGQLETALKRGSVVKSTLMRGTLHLVAAADYPAFAVAWRQQALNDIRGKYRNVTVDEDAIRHGLSAFVTEPRSTDEIRDVVADLCGGVLDPHDLLHYARALLPMTHVYPSGAFKQHGKFSLVGLAADLPVEPAATAVLVRRYLAAYGPATREDIAHFTYLKYRQLDPAVAELDVVRLSDKDGRDLIDLPRAPRPAEDVVAPVRFLAKRDAAVISHKDRTRILPAAYHERVVRKINGDV